MPIDQEEAQRILKGHLDWVDNKRKKWKRHRDLYGDNFWGGGAGDGSGRGVWVTTSSMVPTGEHGDAALNSTADSHVPGLTIEVNLLRPLVTSFVAPLGYQGIHFKIKTDSIDPPEEGVEEREAAEAGVRAINDRWFDNEEVVDTTEREFAMGLLYEGGVAYRVGLADADHVTKDTHLIDRLYLEALPPWECVWDRRSRSFRTQRYMGHLRPVPAEHIDAVTEGDMTALPDVIAEGTKRVPNPQDTLDEGYVYVFELWDLTSPEGAYQAYKVISDSVDGLGVDPKLEPIAGMGPKVPDVRPDGGPVVPIIPFIAEPFLEYPLDGLSAVTSPANLNAELNRALSVIGDAFRRDAARVLMYLKDKISSTDIELIAKAPDMAMVGIEADTFTDVMKFLDVEPISPTILTYIEQIFNGIDRTQLTADMTRGKAGQYLSATEAGALAEYSATMVGRIRRRMDTVHTRVAKVALHLLWNEVSKPIRIGHEGDVVEVNKDVLGRRWNIKVLDAASTPAEQAQHLADFQLILPALKEAAAILADPQLNGSPLQRFAAGVYKEITSNQRLGDDLQMEALLPDGLDTKPPPPPEAEVPPGGEVPPEPVMEEGQPMSPEEQQALMNTPEAQAIMASEGGPVG